MSQTTESHIPFRVAVMQCSIFRYIITLLLSVPVYGFQGVECDPVFLLLKGKDMGTKEVNALICNDRVMVSITDLFSFSRINHTVSEQEIKGYFIEPEDHYGIDFSQGLITYKDKTTELQNGTYIHIEGQYYIEADLLKKIFGLDLSLNYRALALTLQSARELPAQKEKRLNDHRNTALKFRTARVADTTLTRTRGSSAPGSLHWAYNGVQNTNGYTNNRFLIGGGAMVAGGELTAAVNTNTFQAISRQNIFFRWRYVLDSDYIRQVSIGRLATNSIATLYRPVNGIQITNNHLKRKSEYQTYTLTDYAEPNSTVELYINNVLYDFIKTDSSGYYSFEVPLSYGRTSITTKVYNYYGNELVSNKNYVVPYALLKKGKFEYIASAGIIDNPTAAQYANVQFRYGVARGLTLGGGMEYLSHLLHQKVLPFLNATLNLAPNMYISGEYTPGIGSVSSFHLAIPAVLQVEASLKTLEKNQDAVLRRYTQERLASVSLPIKSKSFRGNTQLVVRQNIFQHYTFSSAEHLIIANYRYFNLRIMSHAFCTAFNDPTVFTDFSADLKLAKKWRISPLVQYDYGMGKLTNIRLDLRRDLFKNAYLNASFENNIRHDRKFFQIGLRYDLNFAQVSASASIADRYSTFSQSASGGLILDPRLQDVSFQSHASLGMGAIRFIPFLDRNNNQKKDPEEPIVENFIIKSARAGTRKKVSKGTISFFHLEPYTVYHFDFSTAQLGYINRIIHKKSLAVELNPNQTRLIEIPIALVGEATGYILPEAGTPGGIKLQLRDENDHILKEVQSEPDGYFSFFGLTRGSYKVTVDSLYLVTAGLQCKPAGFTISNLTDDGDYLDNLLLVPFIADSKVIAGTYSENPTDTLLITEKTGVDKSRQGSGLQKNEAAPFVIDLPSKGIDNLQLYSIPGVAKVDSDNSGYILTPMDSTLGKALQLKKELHQRGITTASIRASKGMGTKNTIQGYTYVIPDSTGIGGITVKMFDENKKLMGTTLTELDGNFIFYDIKPGIYRFEPDSIQLAAIKMQGVQEESPEEVQIPDSIKKQPHIYLRSGSTDIAERPREKPIYKIQILASKKKMSGKHKYFKKLPGVERHFLDGLYKYTYGNCTTLSDIRTIRDSLRYMGYEDCFIVQHYKTSRQNLQVLSGTVLVKQGKTRYGLAGIKMNVYDETDELVTSIYSNAQGEFEFIGLLPGEYKVKADKEQLRELGLSADKKTQEVTIRTYNSARAVPRIVFILSPNSYR